MTHFNASHFREICQYGFVHAQCRCPGDQVTHHVLCDIPEHAKSIDPEPANLTLDILAQLVAAHVSGSKDAVAEQKDRDIANTMLATMERELFRHDIRTRVPGALPDDLVEFAVNHPEMREFLKGNRIVQAIKFLRETYHTAHPTLYIGLREAKDACDTAHMMIRNGA